MLSPTISPAEVIAQVFPISKLSRTSTSIAALAGPAPDSSGIWHNCPEIPMIRCDSPLSLYCTGHCRTNDLYPQQSHLSDKADVICLSAAKGSQRSWETPQGSSLTRILLEFLKKTPNPTIRDVLTAVSHGVHSFCLDMHQNAREYKQALRDVNNRRKIRGRQPLMRRPVEADNFQDPQISSHKPLDMNRPWQM